MTIHDYEYYQDSYMVSISVHKYMIKDKGTCSCQVSLSSLYSDFMKFVTFSINFCMKMLFK